jgi:N,N-dimethylformamidase beta subunit-like, C-terminal
MPPTTSPDRRSRVPTRPAVAATVVALLVVVALVAVVVRPGLPGPPGGTPGPASPGPRVSAEPIETGHLVEPSGPGATPVRSADTMPFQRPIFSYMGNLPWQISNRPDAGHVLEGYASRPSYLPGDTLRLAVSTTAASYDVTIFRVSGRAPASSPFVEVGALAGLPGHRQAAPTVDPSTRMAAARWSYDVQYDIPPTWPSDVYLARLSSSQGVQAFVPFIVRSPGAHRYLVVSSAMNWQAYNQWGGSSAYMTSVGTPPTGVSRALAVSFDRPYMNDGGAGQLFFLELPFVSWILRQGVDVAFTTDYDLSLDPEAQPLPKVLIFNGHDEYWGVGLYQWLDRHVNQLGDMGVAMLAADTGYWPVSFAGDSPDGPRDLVILKDGPLPAPGVLPDQSPGGSAGSTAAPASPGASAASGMPGSSSASSAPGAFPAASETPASEAPALDSPAPGSTAAADVERSSKVMWTIPAAGPYVGSLPGQPIFGVRYRGVTTRLGRYTLADPAPDPRLLAGTGLSAGSSIGFIAGGEVDGVYQSATWWGPFGGRYDHDFAIAADIPGRTGYSWTAEAVWRELPNGGRVFSAGTFYWGWALDPAWGAAHDVAPGFGRLTRNILDWLAGS